jgi:DNA-binding MarR family transcriptional regulator
MATDTKAAPGTEALANDLRNGIGLLLRRLRRLPVEGDLTLPQISALVRLDRFGPATAGEMAKAEQISPQSMGATVAALESRGLLRRTPDPDDGRRVILSPTAAGARTLRNRRDAKTKTMAAALDLEFTAAELEALRSAAPLIERLAQSI